MSRRPDQLEKVPFDSFDRTSSGHVIICFGSYSARRENQTNIASILQQNSGRMVRN
jgi:hypothetical protein